jgi:hypothetical protein
LSKKPTEIARNCAKIGQNSSKTPTKKKKKKKKLAVTPMSGAPALASGGHPPRACNTWFISENAVILSQKSAPGGDFYI